jgi:D-alanyl-D-alanine carboxypeptidase (penicillin-binding protein 5/6)
VPHPLTAVALAASLTWPGVALPAAGGDPQQPTTNAGASSSPVGPVGGPKLTGDDVITDTDINTPPPPKVKATSWLIADLATGEVLAAKGPHVKLRPASTITTLTALVLLPRLNKDDMLFADDGDVDVDGGKVGISPGVRYSVDQLFQAMFLTSAPDAVHALARYDDGLQPTVQRMNANATALGLRDTHVVDPAGNDSASQVTSAYDLAVISRTALQRPDFSTYAATKTAQLPQATGGPIELNNQNRLLWEYPGAMGVKTGYSTLARNATVGAAERDGRRLVVTILDSDSRVTTNTEDLLTWAFTNRQALRSIGTLNATGEVAAPEDRSGGMTAGGMLKFSQHKIGPVPTWVLGLFVLVLSVAGWRVLGSPARAAAAGDGAGPRRAKHRGKRAKLRM